MFTFTDSQKIMAGEPGLPDGDSQIISLYVLGPLGFWTMAPLRSAAKFGNLEKRETEEKKIGDG